MQLYILKWIEIAYIRFESFFCRKKVHQIMIEKKHVVQCRISVVYLEHSIKVCQSWALVVRLVKVHLKIIVFICLSI